MLYKLWQRYEIQKSLACCYEHIMSVVCEHELITLTTELSPTLASAKLRNSFNDLLTTVNIFTIPSQFIAFFYICG